MSLLQDKIIEYVIINVEGVKYTNTPGDKGGPTKFGITQATYSAYLKRPATADDVKNMTMEIAIDVYKKMFWTFFNLDLYPVEFQHLIFDMYVNHSPAGVGKIIQKSLNDMGSKLVVDGVVGHKTLNEIPFYKQNVLFNTILNRRSEYYNLICKNDPTQLKFLNGWLNNRVEWFRKNKLTVDGVVKLV